MSSVLLLTEREHAHIHTQKFVDQFMSNELILEFPYANVCVFCFYQYQQHTTEYCKKNNTVPIHTKNMQNQQLAQACLHQKVFLYVCVLYVYNIWQAKN